MVVLLISILLPFSHFWTRCHQYIDHPWRISLLCYRQFLFAKKDKIRRVGFCDIPLVNQGGSDLCSCQSQQMSLYSIVVAWFRRKREQLTHLLRRNPSHKTEAANSANVRKSEIVEESESRTSCGIVGAQSALGLQKVRTSLLLPPLVDKGLSMLGGSCS